MQKPLAKGAKMSGFQQRMPASARRHVFLRQSWLFKERDAPVNPNPPETADPEALTRDIKDRALALGADAIGIAAYEPSIRFADSEVIDHKAIIVIAMNMSYDLMVNIGPKSQAEVHRVYYEMEALGVKLAKEIGAYGYAARTQPNIGDFPLPALGWAAGLGELGKHGSLISPELGSSFRLSAISTDMPLVSDGPRDLGLDEICSKCQICARFCPGDAIKHEKKEVNGVQRWYVDTPACEPYFFGLHGCKICLSVCPLNARGALRDKFKLIADDIRDAENAAGMLDLLSQRSGIDFAANMATAMPNKMRADADREKIET